MTFSPISSWQIDVEKVGTVRDFIFLVSKITEDSDCSHEIKRGLLLGRKAMTNLDAKGFHQGRGMIGDDQLVDARRHESIHHVAHILREVQIIHDQDSVLRPFPEAVSPDGVAFAARGGLNLVGYHFLESVDGVLHGVCLPRFSVSECYHRHLGKTSLF